MFVHTVLAAAAFLSATSAHMFVSSPKPIEGTAPKSPLDASGSDFPCHGVSLPSSGGQEMLAGSKQRLAFDLGNGANTAVHGGESCQLSITYETEPVKLKDPSNWKVIYSIEGGCPSDTSGNLEVAVACTGSNGPNCVNSFPFTIPKGVRNGHAIMAWTWFNSVGDREIYMNCFNAQFSGGDGSEMSGFPSMFVANMASIDTCPTTENVNVKFPSPGKYVTTATAGNPYPLAVPIGAGCSAVASGHPNNLAGNAQSASSSAVVGSTSTTFHAVFTTRSRATSSTATNSASSSTSSGLCASGYVSCATPGEIICVDSVHFGICDFNNCALPQVVAPGTTCSGDAISRKAKRHLDEHKREPHHGPHARFH